MQTLKVFVDASTSVSPAIKARLALLVHAVVVGSQRGVRAIATSYCKVL